MPLKIDDYATASEFLTALRPSHADWQNRGGIRRWVFRGQHDAALLLIPSLCRPGLLERYARLADSIRTRAKAAVTKHRWWGVDEARGQRAEDAMLRALLQTQMVSEFAQLVDQLGYPIGATFPPSVEELLSNNGGELASWPQLAPTPAMALAHHHGIPTLLLDWTWDALVAAYFAADGKDSTAAQHIGVFAADVSSLAALAQYHCPRHQMEFLHAQRGLFLHLRTPWNTFDSMGRWAAFDEIEVGQNMRCLRLPASEAGALAEMLSYESITHAHLMPTLDNVTTTLSKRWQ